MISIRKGAATGWALLLTAGALVGVAIAVDGGVSRALNGVGGVLWLAAALLLIRDARRWSVDGRTWLIIGLAVLTLSGLLSPRDLTAASVGFLVGGWVIARVARPSAARSTVVGLLPALWLPAHLGLAAIRAAYRALADQPADIRTDPPPTAALVPLAMVVAALLGGHLAERLLRRRSSVDPRAGEATG